MRRARAAATGIALLVPALLLGAGDAAGERAAVSPAQTVKSADGGLTVSVPRGALAKPVRVRVRTLTRGQYPPEVRNATFRPGTKVYALDPSGTRFLKPVTITRRIDTKLAGFEQGKVPGVILATRDASRKWALLKGMRARLDGRILVVSGTTRHFSSLLALDQGFDLSLIPARFDGEVGDTWEAEVLIKIDNRRRRDPIKYDDDVRWWAAGAVKFGGAFKENANFRCARPGTGTYKAVVEIIESSLAVAVASGFKEQYREYITVVNPARCRAKGPPPPTRVELVAACVAVAHTPFAGGFPSSLRWLLQVANAPANARTELTVNGMNNQQPVVGTVGANGRVELRGGIDSYGPKQVQRIGVAGVDLTSQLVAKVGAAPVVTSSEGVIGGTCP
jgi:hypothetical protein